MHVKGLKEGGAPLADIGMVVPFNKIIEIPHNLARRSKDLQAAIDVGDVHPAPTKAAQEAHRNAPRPKERPVLPPRSAPPVKGPSHAQEIAELKRLADSLGQRVATLEGSRDALQAKLDALIKNPESVTKKSATKKTATKKTKKSKE